ncbi:hypothetical protein [Aquiflexum gelatinilyticum]|uniref:hypothetical protein n=1 Tax=Aquiflexum gelatinilyticum TaxID=2961943 RepID=UPI0021688A8F|nr:hypothetical protein [Aquiflexum gelatinilyticum]MCS4436042.1 hypothetical protein [Aquiflexum gelatinilyticum]
MKALLIIGIFFISQVTIAQVDCSERLVKTKTSNGIIMTVSSLIYSIPKDFSRFIPDKEDIIQIEKLLKTKIAKINKEHPNQFNNSEYLENNLLNYNRQYFGYIDENGEKVIYINLFKESVECDMDTELMVLDGCSNYWRISFVLDTQEFRDFSVNGCA